MIKLLFYCWCFLTAWKIDIDGNSGAFFTLIISHFRIQGLIELTFVCNRNAVFVSVDTRWVRKQNLYSWSYLAILYSSTDPPEILFGIFGNSRLSYECHKYSCHWYTRVQCSRCEVLWNHGLPNTGHFTNLKCSWKTAWWNTLYELFREDVWYTKVEARTPTEVSWNLLTVAYGHIVFGTATRHT